MKSFSELCVCVRSCQSSLPSIPSLSVLSSPVVSPGNSVNTSMMEMDGSIALSCEAMGGPNNTFLWVRQDLGMGSVEVGNTSLLMIESATVLDGGEYVCIVNNSAGVGTDTVPINGSFLISIRLIPVLPLYPTPS